MTISSVSDSSSFGTYLKEQVTYKLENFKTEICSIFSGGSGDGKTVVDLALTCLGDNENDGSADKYLDGGSSSATPWCGAFVNKIFQWAEDMGFQPKNWVKDISNPLYCPSIQDTAQNSNAIVNTSSAKPGDIVLFDWDGDGVSDHTGIVAENNGGTITTVEGNTSNQVGQRTYSASDSRLTICSAIA